MAKRKIVSDISELYASLYEPTMEIYFDNLEEVLKDELRKTSSSLKIVVGWLDFSRFEDIFNLLTQNNVSIKVIVDDNPKNRKFLSETNLSTQNGIEIKFQQMLSGTYGVMHHKFCIIDSKVLINGSYNWTYTANTYSFENFIISRDNQITIDKFSDEFDVIDKMTPQRLHSIQYLKPCNEPGCSGKLTNLLVYGPHVEKYGEMVGDIVAICSDEPYEHYETIEQSVIDNTISRIADEIFYMYDDAFELYQLNDEELTEDKINQIKENLNYLTERKYMIYSNNHGINNSSKTIIHGWGKIKSYPMTNKHEDPDYFTKVYWKDRFVGVNIEDEYEYTFGLY